jgi:hypothetical protein
LEDPVNTRGREDVRRQQGWVHLVGCAALALVPTACESSTFGFDPDQGIEILALLGPICPVESEEAPCPDEPYQAWIQVRSRQGLIVTRIRTAEDGRARIGLGAGLYVVHPESGDPFPVASEQEVTVVRDHFTEVTLHFDTGIR